MPEGPQLVADARCQIAEGPVWHPDEDCLYWSDILAGAVYRYDPARGTHAVVYRGDLVGGITVQHDGSLLLLGARGSVRSWREGAVRGVILASIPGEENSRFNDAIADPCGRIISGTMAVRDATGQVIRHGRLYRLDPSGHYWTLLGGMGSPNGMGFTADLHQLYLTDSITGTQAIFRHAYDPVTGALGTASVFYQAPLDGSAGRPDGMAVDIDVCIWSALWDGAAVVRLGPDGAERERVSLPVRKVTSVAFGGADLADLYISTASLDSSPEDQPGAGGIFRLRTGTAGRPAFRSRIPLHPHRLLTMSRHRD